jgi:hypothetical protein
MSEKITIELSTSDCTIIKNLLSEVLPEQLEESNVDEVMIQRFKSLKNLRTALEGAIGQ